MASAFTYEDLPGAVGADLGRTGWVEIDQHRIDAFAEITEDRQWIHVDPDRAARSQFGSTIAHGYLTLSLVGGFLGELLRFDGVGMSINYGSDRVRFIQPVNVGSRLRGHGQVVDVEAVAGGAQVTVRVTVEIDGTDRPACITDALIRVLPTQ